ncbi:SinI family restriction endonuclease [Cohnella abietis]|uniref:Uncharacterized protein n=1 Tax=Cohnella abietis TaxID=2507935 RepID=A0A3T1CY49_9BACL|nr:SinI family restriction endonuclease [Cohnella abietis]BBI30766.1 hypothetical protein KCTCHS21_01650 [Cohnella abietis]
MAININDFFDLNLDKKENIITELKKKYSFLTPKQQTNLYQLIDLAVEFKQIPDQIQSKDISALPLEKQILPLLQKWLNNNVNSITTRNNARLAKPFSDKDTVEDPALAHMLSTYFKVDNYDLTGDCGVEQHLQSHQILMAIENIQGHLLEEYIASVICGDPFNFLWCDGQTIKAADFCKRIDIHGEPSLLRLIQIKNKYNTENSSSSKIREDTPIVIWYRLGKKKIDKKNVPDYKWDDLNNAVEGITGHNPDLSEEKYLNFLENIITHNPKIFYNEA